MQDLLQGMQFIYEDVEYYKVWIVRPQKYS